MVRNGLGTVLPSSMVDIESGRRIVQVFQRCGSKTAQPLATLSTNGFLYGYITVTREWNQIATFTAQDIDDTYLREAPGFGSSDLDVSHLRGRRL